MGYTAHRRSDPRLAAAIWAGLGDARTVLNVGAGAGAYEPPDRDVVAVEPSLTMIAQRPSGSAPVVRGSAEALPFDDFSFDAVMAVFSDHHWADRATGLREARRVARDRVVLVNVDPELTARYWMTAEYLTGFTNIYPPRLWSSSAWKSGLREHLGPLQLDVVPIPHDCQDGFYAAYWRRPHAYLDRRVRENISVFARLPPAHVEQAISSLSRDLDTGAWEARHADLLSLDDLDVGFRVISASIPGP
jgi:SAM-dependent methyltransferase